MSHTPEMSTVAAAAAAVARSTTAMRFAVTAPLRSARRHPGALGHEAMHRFLGTKRGREAAVHHHAGERIGIEAGELLVLFEQIDHVPGGVVHGLVEVGIAG